MKKNALIIIILFLATVLLAEACWAEKIGVITDIHAGTEKIRNRSKYSTGNIVYPRKYEKYFKSALKKMKAAGAGTIISLGDQIDKGNDAKRARKLKSMAQKAGMEIIWVKGNHEDKKTTTKFFFPDGLYYYENDLNDGWKIIVLDSNEKYSLINGGIKDEQLAWLEEKISSTEKNILIAMHHPIFRIREELPNEIAGAYKEFEPIVSSSGKVKYVLAGHTHPQNLFEKDLHGVQYYVLPPLTIKGNLGYYMVLDLE